MDNPARQRSVRRYWLILASLPVLLVGANLLLLFIAYLSRTFSLVRMAYTFDTIIFPVTLVVEGVYGLSLWRDRRSDRWLLRASAIALIAAVCCFGIRVYATHVEPRRLVIKNLTIDTHKVKRPVSILHISDIQSGGVGSFEEMVFSRIRALEPDIILFTGDLLQPIPPASCESELPKIAALFRTLDPPMGMFGVLGNVDRSIRGVTTEQLGGLEVLEGEDTAVSTGGRIIRIYGLTYEQSRKERDRDKVEPVISPQESSGPLNFRIRKWLETTGKNDFTIILGHKPDYILSVQNLNIDLCLAGHTHGGQVRLPFLGPLVTLSTVPRSWARGYREIGATRLNISAGIGSEHAGKLPSIRINCPPEMTLIKLRPSAGD